MPHRTDLAVLAIAIQTAIRGDRPLKAPSLKRILNTLMADPRHVRNAMANYTVAIHYGQLALAEMGRTIPDATWTRRS